MRGVVRISALLAALNTASVPMSINAKVRKAAEERKRRVPLRLSFLNLDLFEERT